MSKVYKLGSPWRSDLLHSFERSWGIEGLEEGVGEWEGSFTSSPEALAQRDDAELVGKPG